MSNQMYRKTLIIVVILLSLLGVYVVAMGRTPKDVPQEKTNSEKIIAPDFSLKDLNGKTHKLSDYKGKYVFLNFWAMWCPPCRQEMPDLQKMFEVSDKQEMVMLMVDVRENSKDAKKFAAKNKYTFTILNDQSGSVADSYRVFAFPTTYIIDKQGFIMGKVSGLIDWDWQKVKKVLNDDK